MTAGAALQKFPRRGTRAKQVRGLLRSLGQREERMALSHRYAEAMGAPVDLADRAARSARELMLAVSDLMQLLERDFLR